MKLNNAPVWANHLQTFLLWICLIILGVGYVSGIVFQFEAIRFRYPLDYGEAPLINQAIILNMDQTLYKTDYQEAP